MEKEKIIATNRRNFLKGIGASATGIAATLVVSEPGTAVIDVQAHAVEDKHKFVTHEHFLTHGDGTKEGDLATIKVDGQYRSHVLRSGKWRAQFMD